MRFNMKRMIGRWLSVAAVVAIYFVAFPGDLVGVPQVIQDLTTPARSILSLSYSVSPWAYILAVAALVCATLTRLFGKVRVVD